MEHWELLTHALTDEHTLDLRRLPSAKGVWAPCLTYCEQDGLFYVVFGIMNSMNARYFDIDNYLICAPDIQGPWSEPVYLHSAGFDASLFHDDDGRKWVVSLDWETRDGYEKPGQICIAEYDPTTRSVKGSPVRIWRGATDRGCLEAPHLTKHDGRYYLMCAEGGTGYYHCVTMARAESPLGPYEADPANPILTSVPENRDERADAQTTTKLEFEPTSYQHSAGLVLYYDNMNYAYLRISWSESLGCRAISVVRVDNGQKTDCEGSRLPAPEGPLWFRLRVSGRTSQFSWSRDGTAFETIGPAFDTSEFSDEYSRYGEFTGTLVGIACTDQLFHRACADFDLFAYEDL